MKNSYTNYGRQERIGVEGGRERGERREVDVKTEKVSNQKTDSFGNLL